MAATENPVLLLRAKAVLYARILTDAKHLSNSHRVVLLRRKMTSVFCLR